MLNKLKREQIGNLFTQIQHAYSDAESFRSEQTKDYTNAWDYYLAKKPVPVVKNGCNYVSPVVQTAVDKILPPQLSLFTATDNQAVSYRPTGVFFDKQGNVLPTTLIANAVNKIINEVFLRENNGYEVYNEAFTEALITGGAYIKWYVSQDVIEDCIEFKDWVPATVIKPLMLEWPHTDFSKLEYKVEKEEFSIPEEDQVLAASAGKALPSEIEQEIPLLKGKINLVRIERKLKVDSVPFNEMFVDENALDITSARYVCHRKLYTVGSLIEMGFDEEKVKNGDEVDGQEATDKRKIMVNGTFVNDGTTNTRDVDPMERKIHLFEHYIYSSLLDKKGKTSLYCVFATDKDILSVEEVDSIPFTYGKVLTIPGSYLGNSVYNLFKNIQDFKSEAIRVQTDSSRMNTYGRWTGLKGGYDKRSLLDWRPGGVVEITTPGAVGLMPHTSTPPEFENVYAKIDNDMNSILGSTASEAFNPSSLNNSTAAAVSMVMGNQELKDKRIGGTLARTLVKPMFEGLYRILREEAVNMKLDDGSVFNSSQLPKLANFVVDINTVNDDAVVNGTLANILQIDATIGNAAGNVNAREIYKRMLKTVGGMTSEEVETYLPTKPQPTEEEVMKQQALEVAQFKQLESNISKTDAEIRSILIDIARKEAETSELIRDGVSQRQRAEEDSLRKFKELDIKAAHLGVEVSTAEHDVVMDQAELDMEAKNMAETGKYTNAVIGQRR